MQQQTLSFGGLSGIIFFILISFLLLFPLISRAALDTPAQEIKPKGPVRTDVSQINKMNRVHRRSNIYLNITNWGFFGNTGENRTRDKDYMTDPCTGEWAPQCEYPGGSRINYMFMGSLWLGALIRAEGFEYPRVSVGMDGWLSVHEFWPGEGATNSQDNGIIERTTLPLEYDCIGNYIGGFQDSAISEQDFVCSYSDTLTEPFFVTEDAMDGPHNPLGIKIVQKSYTWTYNYAQNFIIIDWEIENIAGNYLKNLYVGLYIDADVGRVGNMERHTDDINGFQKWFYYETETGLDSSVINTAWIADNDGRHQDVSSGTDFEAPAVTGVRVVRAPNPKLRTSYNWWISNGDPDLDFGPSWKDDGAPAAWTNVYGTPMGDVKKYFVLSNREFDYDQVYVRDAEYIGEHSQVFLDRWDPDADPLETHDWKVPGVDDETPENLLDNLANGYDTRYLLSWGPLGIFDHYDDAGNRIYRLNPGEKFSMTIAVVAGDNFHDPNNPQPTNEIIDPDLFNFNSLRYNSDWAARVYDNPMIDTPIYDWGADGIPGTGDQGENDGILDTGDGWFGEDVGNDGLFGIDPGDTCYVWIGETKEIHIYPGPDPDGSENDEHLSLSEDTFDRPKYLEYTKQNGMLDYGDGHPDFKGPPPPPTPTLNPVKDPIRIQVNPDSLFIIDDAFLEKHVVIHWSKYPSENPDYKDPFSREWDFEGYRVYISNTNIERDFALLDEFDRIDYALYSGRDSLASQPVTDPSDLPEDGFYTGIYLYGKEVGKNIGFFGHNDLLTDTLTNPVNWDYYYIIRDAHPMVPRYYSVTSFDYGDYKTGTESLETAKIANSIYMAPSGNQRNPVMVVPNPYRANEDYTVEHGGVSWENRNDGTYDFFPQTDRRLYFYNLPMHCLIRIYTVSGDLVDIVPHNLPGDDNQGWADDYAEAWDLNSRNHQQVVSGMYLFTVEEFDDNNKNTGDIEVSKFVVIR
ncbi:MAG: hypothetical protein P9X24_10660 [Candidatus Hatepunaea meridiana]|nr:hypothetical protein [Candidatus Hatepunaea meridiana]